MSFTAPILKKRAVFRRHYEDLLYSNIRKVVQEVRKSSGRNVFTPSRNISHRGIFHATIVQWLFYRNNTPNLKKKIRHTIYLWWHTRRTDVERVRVADGQTDRRLYRRGPSVLKTSFLHFAKTPKIRATINSYTWEHSLSDFVSFQPHSHIF